MKTPSAIIGLVVLRHGIDPLKGVTKKLQKRDADIADGYAHIDESVNEIHEIRENMDTKWPEWFSEAGDLADNLGIELKRPRTARLQKHRANPPSDDHSSFFKRSIAIPFMDSLFNELKTRFSPANRKLKSPISLCGSAICDASIEEMMADLQFWQTDMPDPTSLKSELIRWRRKWLGSSVEKRPTNLIDSLRNCDEDIYYNIQ